MNYPTATPYRSKSDVVQLYADRQIFRDSEGNAIGLKGISAFNLMDKFYKGDDTENYLSKFIGANLVRIFLYTPEKDWGSSAWNSPDNDQVANFIIEMGKLGYYVKLVLLTDDDINRVQPAIDLVYYLKQFKFSNLLLAAGNEPLTHKNIDVTALYNILLDSGYPSTSGVYEDLHKFYGSFGDVHTGRDYEWPRKAKDAIEAYRGGGPNSLDEPPCKVPWILGEPIRPDQALDYGNETFCLRDFYSYGAWSKLAGAGIVFHSESGKLCVEPTSFELDCYEMMMLGYEVFPPDAATGDYQHLGDLEDGQTKALRVYRVGHWVVVIRPNNFIPPPNWKPLDDYSVCFEIM